MRRRMQWFQARWRTGLAGMLVALVAGCAATRGAPASFLTVESAEAAGEVKNIAMNRLKGATTADERNLHLADAMADVDVFYVQFRDALVRGDNQFNAGVDLVSLMADLAGGLTDSAGVKDNYLTLSTLLAGGRATVSNRFLYAQTSLALIKGMDAARTQTALAIKQKQADRTFAEYTGRDAYADVLKYYFDGTLAGGLAWLQANAATVEAEDNAELATLRVPTPAQLEERETLQEKVAARRGQSDAIERAMKAWGMDTPAGEDADARWKRFIDEYRRRIRAAAQASDVEKQLQDAKFFED